MGRVVEGDCASPTQQLQGVAGVRVYLEDGRYSVTDDEGKYHFEDVAPGSHVVQMDTVTIPDTHQLAGCIDRVRNAGRAYSQFVDVRGGALWRSDFVLGAPAACRKAAWRCSSRPPSPARRSCCTPRKRRSCAAADSRGARDADAARGPGVSGRAARSSMVRRSPIRSISSNVLTFALGDVQHDREAKLTLRTSRPRARAARSRVKAVAMFDTPSAAAQRTAPVENVILRGEMLYESASYRFSPRFDVLDVTDPAGRPRAARQDRRTTGAA